MQKILDMVNQNIQHALKKFQDTKNKEHEMKQKQIKELREDLKKTTKWSKEHNKKRDTWIKKDNTNYKRRIEQRFGKP
jgi:hypothetical protein